MPFELFDRSKIKLKPLKQRIHDLTSDFLLDIDSDIPEFSHEAIDILVEKIVVARKKNAPVIFMMGAHVIKDGTSKFLIELMKRGIVTHFALNGAGSIHDYELSLIGATTESVAKYIKEGQFGLWSETGKINEAAIEGAKSKIGLGEAIGKKIEEENNPRKDISLLAAGYRLQVPVTVHVGIGCDIIHEHPNCDGAALGETSYTDFLIYAKTISNLTDGVFVCLGSAVIGPEVYLKCLAMARNVAHQNGEEISNFTTAVFDLLPIDSNKIDKTPPKSDPRYYFRPWKTILARTVEGGGESYYVQGEHRRTVPNLAVKLFEQFK